MHTTTDLSKPPGSRGLSTVANHRGSITRAATQTVGEGRKKTARLSPTPPGRGSHTRAPIGERTARIEGSFRRITVHQLTLAWWLYAAGHITKRQYRLYFAAHELAERRRYTSPEHRGSKPLYTMTEFSRLVGGQGGQRALRELRGDMRRLSRLGLVRITKHAIVFAVSADQITLGGEEAQERGGGGGGDERGGGVDDLSGFWSMFNAMPNHRRSVPVPRRLLRALAAGFSKGATALISALLIRGLFWHKQTGDYRTDGRYKLSWIAEHFGISRRAATEARAGLIALGWIEPLAVNQWEMNRWGLHDRIVPEWSHTDQNAPGQHTDPQAAVGGPEQGGRKEETQAHTNPPSSPLLPPHPGQPSDSRSASPKPENDTRSASPDLTDSLSLTGDLKTRKLHHTRNRTGVSPGSTRGKEKTGGRKKSRGGKAVPPSIRDIRAGDLGDTGRLLELHRQACAIGLASSSEAGRLDFMALAQRARCRGRRAGAMFYWLLRERKTAFITLADEDQANQMLREHLHGSREQWGGGSPEDRGLEPLSSNPQETGPQYTDDDRFALACIRVAKKHRIDPWRIARENGWTRERWQQAFASYEDKQRAQQRASICFGDA